ncbi:MBOAT family O-acyltransferase [Methylocystis parvus]|uniref:Probable alginate O-acetylase AlgI n=1 Tax=Methylocystis parvus TaxID=134 RepID=A0A6B8M579_9HYPH|nr:MBOAT family O-acyltransferase [Methylocystis parvus]QGM99134.1 MBOAT family protein [Methylocystis parvus]WBK00495.1 MBOAT family protein [Methylocystis parvus OBBP]
MLFYEPLFLFLFAPAVYLLYLFFGADRHRRAIILLLASVVFYGWSEPAFIFVVFASVALDLYVAQRITGLSVRSVDPVTRAERAEGETLVRADVQGEAGGVEAEARRWLALGVAANLAILVYYKYTGFLALNFDALLRAFTLPGVHIPEIALPIGVSFVVFEKITYLVDVYRGVTAPARGPLLYALYVFFFPKLLAGPIIKYHDIAGQFETCPHAHVDDFVNGFRRFMLGVVKKLLVADVMASGADMIFARDPATLGFAEAWAGTIFFTLQIYFDFSGYSDMAIGLARMFGFRLLENFNMPYIATSITEFWRRWHMSLTSWIREYLYFPLGGNRVGEARTYFNLWICFLASGVWHGAAWTYIFWGAYNGVFLVLDRLFLLERLNRLPAWAANIATMFIVMIGWTLFRANSLDQAGALLFRMAQPWAQAGVAAAAPSEYVVMAAIAVAICVAQRVGASCAIDWTALARRHAFAVNGALSILFVAALAKGLADPFKPFIYFRF